MVNVLAKNKAQLLRIEGKSISEISEKLNIPRSTIGIWCRNIKLGKRQIERLEKRQKSGSYKGRMIFLERLRSRRLLESRLLRIEGIKEIGIISKRDLFISGLAFYISEGSTSDCGEEVSFTNSDYRTILFMKKWFWEICGISNDRFAIQIRINNVYRNKIKKIEKYWSEITNIPLCQFTKTILIKSKLNKIYPKNSVYYGTIRLKIKKGTKLRRKINGWVEGLLEN
ncbi:MAG: hypothetical protein A2312_04020 [Candidatus Staskawiczbacteria bacterium RIFOXYB2_FULL_32_9]|uniref:Uncharacterized protein n=1 Tax=Candidatus Staskawiczbacteria bacterium RIFOXYD1_FULL_32_13 TaxID=1802234 RepID=A0A1G2JPB1_9BACT|nr:MAG: hypothetical protein UR22_C0011G0002 [Parcubacteria group bacterium GW2011_GWC2_32_10]OGZ84165.1 MAG: hypothetical protein A2312_04020 [Candidatus Staskawiczbacteria bacterium RIFOXYB2_FULL_32_9]OGZ88120.1 MAG: hypothetical protein A2561_01415 [Candidatus Staskawiczbacteria bacterium RIFOXYD1_FULL_32_13]OGZ88295.1 MAG: hypothetical protein A2463_01675 [Candidatus Staskawiczbacteria bacterium RIFOXYC2_FULL_32_10]